MISDDSVDDDEDDDRSRFDFSDTDFNGGMNFIVGMRKQSGTFYEMKATAWGVSINRAHRYEVRVTGRAADEHG